MPEQISIDDLTRALKHVLGRNSDKYDIETYDDIMISLHNMGIRNKKNLYSLLYENKDEIEDFIKLYSTDRIDYLWVETDSGNKFERGLIKAKVLSNNNLIHQALLVKFGAEAMYR